MLICLHVHVFEPPALLHGFLMKLRIDTSHIKIAPPPQAAIGMLMKVEIASQRWNFNKHPFKARRFEFICLPVLCVCVRVFPPHLLFPLPAAALSSAS